MRVPRDTVGIREVTFVSKSAQPKALASSGGGRSPSPAPRNIVGARGEGDRDVGFSWRR